MVQSAEMILNFKDDFVLQDLGLVMAICIVELGCQ